MLLRIKGFQETTLMEWEGVVAAIVFLGGCNFRCIYCHNHQIAFTPEKVEDIPREYVFTRLKELKHWIDGVVISGGEPTIYGDELITFMERLKKEGFKIKLYTNGSNHAIIAALIEEGLVDAISMDIKHVFSKYHEITDMSNDDIVLNVKKSIDFLKNRKDVSVKYRLTIVKGVHTFDDISIIKEYVRPRPLIIQNVSLEHVPDTHRERVIPFTACELEEIQKI